MGVGIYLREQRRGGRDRWRYKDVMRLAKLTQAACLDEPSDVSAHMRPPKPQGN